MRERLTARVLLLDPDARLLLMKGRLPSAPNAAGHWFTVGGGAEPGETVEAAAAREIVEETGFRGARLGPVVWRRDGPVRMADGEDVLFKEHYIVAHCAAGEPSRAGWDAQERALIDDIAWWSLADLRVCPDPVHPLGLVELLPDILAGRYPDPPRRLVWS